MVKNYSESVTKRDHMEKITGKAMYVADYPMEGMLYGKLVRSTKAHANILRINYPELPPGYFSADYSDIPGANEVHIVLDDTPVFAEKVVEYIGDPIAMIMGPDEEQVEELANAVEVEYEELEALFDPEASDVNFFEYSYEKGDMDKAFSEADFVHEEKIYTGRQEHGYLETQGMIGEFKSGEVYVHGSMQCPYYVHGAVAKVMGFEKKQVHITQDVTGGGFGGKEDYPSVLAAQVCVASKKAGKPVRVVLPRREDMEVTSKRHPCIANYKLAVKDGMVTAMDIVVLYDSGGYTTLSAVVLQRGLIGSNGVYAIPNQKVYGAGRKTNTVPSGAFRGFGGPQTFCAVEIVMEHVANRLGVDVLEFKKKHFAKKGDETSTEGRYHFDVPLLDMAKRLEEVSGYKEKRAAYAKQENGRYKKGIGYAAWYHGAGFTGSGERDLIKAIASLRKYADGRVEILTSNTDMGQGLKTTFSKIVANELGMKYDDIIIENPCTDFVHDSGPTAASRSVMVVGELIRRAAARLKKEWVDGQEQLIEEHYTPPEFVIPFSIEEFKGDAYPTFAWASGVVEVEVDTYTGLAKILGAWGMFDVGTPIDEVIVVGQMEGGFLQGIGYGSMEQIAPDAYGRIRNNSYSDYIMPTSMDVPNMSAELFVVEFPDGPYGAKGAGELPTVGGAAAYMLAVEQALDAGEFHHIPFSPEDTMRVLREKGVNHVK